MTSKSPSIEQEYRPRVDAYSAVKVGARPSRAHDYVFIAERDATHCALLVGQEVRDDWGERSVEDDTPTPVRVLANANELFLPLAGRTPAERLDHFSKGFDRVLTASQDEMQRDAKEHTGEAPSLTMTLAYVDHLRLFVGHVGDARCYVLRGGQLHRLTTDHTLTSSTSEGPRVSDPMLGRKVLNVAGGFSDDLQTETIARKLEPEDVVFLCTAGVHAGLPELTLEKTLVDAGRRPGVSLDTLADAVFGAVPPGEPGIDRAVALARLDDGKRS